MEDFSRRKFIATSVGLILSSSLFASQKTQITLPKKPFECYVKKGKQKGKRVLIIGGIHGNEIGAYKCADMLIDCEIEQGELIIIPRSNFTSILAKVRGYNGDMNRKFHSLQPNDPDRFFVTQLKEAILEYKPDIVISMHDGWGFAATNPRHWGQSIVIDEKRFKEFDLYKEANTYLQKANQKLHRYKLTLLNTKTFSSNEHKEQRNALTGWCLQQGIKAICVESSRNLSIFNQIYTHLVILEAIFEHYKIKLSPSLSTMSKHIAQWIPDGDIKATLQINERVYKIRKSTTITIPRSSYVKIASVEGTRGSFVVAKGADLNQEHIFTNRPLSLTIKNDYKDRFTINLIPS